MNKPYPPEAMEQAALAALGMLSTDEAATAPKPLVAEMSEALALMGEGVKPVAPPPSAKNRLMARISAWETLKPISDVRRNEANWIPGGAPGVDIKPLFRDKSTGRNTVLVRMQPGARLPAHHHGDDEQCLVLEGDVRWGDLVYEKGDFIVMGKDSNHPEIHSVHGNLLLIMAGHNEFLRA